VNNISRANKKEVNNMNSSENLPSTTSRTTLIIVGWIIEIITNFTGWWILTVIGLILVLIGCYQWTRIKNRHWAFMFWGILAPIGLLGISLLSDKSQVQSTNKILSNNDQNPPINT
jgi:thiol:disulfide interchange protein